LPVCSE
jgi:hypothetical protein